MTRHPIRHRNLARAGVCAAIVFAATVALGQHRKAWDESAYCVGVLRHTKGVVVRLGTAAEGQKQAEQLAQKAAFLRIALGKHDVDAVATRELFAIGRAEAQVCWDQMDMCFDGRPAELEACMEPVKQTCLRTSICSR